MTFNYQHRALTGRLVYLKGDLYFIDRVRAQGSDDGGRLQTTIYRTSEIEGLSACIRVSRTAFAHRPVLKNIAKNRRSIRGLATFWASSRLRRGREESISVKRSYKAGTPYDWQFPINNRDFPGANFQKHIFNSEIPMRMHVSLRPP